MSGFIELSKVLFEAVELSDSLGRDFSGPTSRLKNLYSRLLHGEFNLAVLGQFKRGKSTLLNALLGVEILPTSIVPLTAIPTFIRYGEKYTVRVTFKDPEKSQEGMSGDIGEIKGFLYRFVTESENPKNKFGVSHVDIMLPVSILSEGLVLIDTPGIGSTFQHNTEATLNFLPQCDAALFLVSADPPITEVEVDFLRAAREKIPKFFFVLNKIDYLSLDEKEIAEDFLKQMIVEQADVEEEITVFSLSAREGLKAKTLSDAEGWEKSGMKKLEGELLKFMTEEKSKALREAVGKKAVDIFSDILLRLGLRIRSLEMPLEDLEQRLVTFEHKIEEITREKERVSDLLEGDKKRMFDFLEKLSEELREDAREYLQTVLKERLVRGDGGKVEEEDLQDAVAKAIPGYFEHQSGVATERISSRMGEVLSSHQKVVDRLIESIRKTAADLFEISYRAPEGDKAFRVLKRPYWVTHKWSSGFGPIPNSAIEKLFPVRVQRQKILKRLNEQIETLVRNNVENLRWTIYQSINETFRAFGNALDRRLSDTLGATHGAIKVAMEERKRHSVRIYDDVVRLRSAIGDFNRFKQLLKG